MSGADQRYRGRAAAQLASEQHMLSVCAASLQKCTRKQCDTINKYFQNQKRPSTAGLSRPQL